MVCELLPLSKHTGVEVKGVDLSRSLDEETRLVLNRAFVEHSVLVVRNQNLTATQLRDGVRNFGKISFGTRAFLHCFPTVNTLVLVSEWHGLLDCMHFEEIRSKCLPIWKH